MASPALQQANANWGSAHLLDSAGNPLRGSHLGPTNPNPFSVGGEGGSPHIADIAGLKKNVSLLNWAAAALFVGGISGFLILDERIFSRLAPVQQGITDIKVEQAKQGANIELVLKRPDKIADAEHHLRRQ